MTALIYLPDEPLSTFPKHTRCNSPLTMHVILYDILFWIYNSEMKNSH
uniref:Uncharacterized protein n=1 Tax=Rhizophora mucronata TaxID=61149 RepID=A0A2P2N8L6_RHIMU